ncbi:MAG: hydrogenase maturation nickel metallochaperone HypA [Acidobacteria bacterium]|nr:hydrogenase maturation nickel metallochaperone HypA [Acidobacteriota bacterium]
MSASWVVLAILFPTLGILVGSLLKDSPEPLAIVFNALIPGAGLAMLNRPFLEVIAGGMISLVSLLVLAGPDNLGMYIPVMILGAVWASFYTSLNPLTVLGQPGAQVAASPSPPPIPARQATGRQRSGAEEDTSQNAGYTVTVRCTECGADVEVPVLHRMARCNYCGSAHVVIGQGETLYVAIPDTIQTPEDLRTIVLEYYRYEYYKKLYERQVAPLDRRTSVSGPDGGMVDSPEIAAAAAAAEAHASRAADAYRERLGKVLDVRESQRFWAPYWHGMGTLYEAIFGRDRRSLEKKMMFAVRTVETSTPANDGVELPPMGHLSYLRTLVPAAELGETEMGLPITMDAGALKASYGHLDRKQIDGTLQRIELGTVFTQEVTGLLWRPWRIVEARGGDIAETLLVDAAASSVARALDGPIEADIQPIPGQVRQDGHTLAFIPMECPNCGFEFPFDVNSVVHFCTNCHRAFVIDGRVKKEIGYDRASLDGSAGGDLVPFWRFDLELADASGRVITDVKHLTDGIDGTFDQIGDDAPMTRDSVLVPAFRVINSRLMTAAFQRMSPFTAPFEAVVTNERFPLDERPTPWSVSLPEPEARRFLPLYLANIFTLRDLARANLKSVASGLFETHQRTPGRLIYVLVPRPLTEPFRSYIGRFKTPAVDEAEGTAAPRTRSA